MASNIRRGVSFYSYNYEMYHRQMTLEDCVRETALMGADGIEMLAMQSVNGYPFPDNSFVREWYDLMEKYGTKPVCLDLFNSTSKRGNVPMDETEALEILSLDLHLAHRLGFKIVRATANTPNGVAEKALSLAEKLDVIIGFEIHPPLSMRSQWMDDKIKMIDRLSTKHIGLIPDMGIFAKKVNPILKRRFIYEGTGVEIADKVCDLYEKGASYEQVKNIMENSNLSEKERLFLEFVYKNNYDSPEDVLKFMPYFVHFHGKFYEMNDSCQETSLDYDNVMAKLIEGGYNGYICSEYEGARELMKMDQEIESCEQVRRQHVMLKRYIGR